MDCENCFWCAGIDFKCGQAKYVLNPLQAKTCEFFADMKSLSPPYTLEDGADATTELVSGKSSGLIGGMQ